MWPMSNALYPGLGSTSERPTTADSWKSHRANPFARNVSTRSRRHSQLQAGAAGRSSQDSVEVENLRDLMMRSQNALDALTAAESTAANNSGGQGPLHRGSTYTTHSVQFGDPMWRALSRRSSTATAERSSRIYQQQANADTTYLQGVNPQLQNFVEVPLQNSGDGPRQSRWDVESPASYNPGTTAELTGVVRDVVENHGFPMIVEPEEPVPGLPTDLPRVPSYEGGHEYRHSLDITTELPPPNPQSRDRFDQNEKSHPLGQEPKNRTAPAFLPRVAPHNEGIGSVHGLPREAVQEPTLWPKAKVKTQEKAVKFDQVDTEYTAAKGLSDSDSDGKSQAEELDIGPTQPLHGLRLYAMTLALSMAVFLVAMDVNVIATAVPHITGDFRSLQDVGWYGSAFLMATCGFQVLFGRIYTVYPAKWVFVFAILVFLAGSLAAALASSSAVFIVGRAIQGIGTAGILSGGLIIIAQVVPLRMRSAIGGVIGAMEGVAMISAPLLGGVLTDKLNWRWCFYINLPIGGFVLIVVLLFLNIPEENRPQAAAESGTILQTLYRLDIVGAALLMPPIICLLIAMQEGGTSNSWGSAKVIGLLVASIVLFGVFAYSQHRNADVAMVPFRLIKQRSVLAGFWYILCTASALVIMTYFLPLWFQVVKQTSAIESGIGLLPMLLGVILCVVISGSLVSLLGYYTPFMILGTILMSLGSGLLTTITIDSPKTLLILYPVLFGAGIGVGFQQPIIGCQAALPREDIPVGTSIIVFGQTFGAAIVLSAGDSVFQTRLNANLWDYLHVRIQNSAEVLQSGTSSIMDRLSPEQIPLLIQAVNKSMTQVFYVALVMAALSVFGALGMEWRSVKHSNNDASKDEMEEL